jgi:hypothetical protein
MPQRYAARRVSLVTDRLAGMTDVEAGPHWKRDVGVS